MKGEQEFWEIIKPIWDDERVQSMSKYIQHGKVTTLTHSLRVAKLCYQLDRFFHTHCDKQVLLQAALLHDFYLYDWHQKDDDHRWHGFHHAEVAVKNAKTHFGIDEKTASCIAAHMWPLTLRKWPRYKEAWILTLADKLISIKETILRK
ncbi:MAG: HD domain-containing protein [Bacilli bacterium]|nr:HD domain-containing protein [Bacilli bacterium]MBO6285797.1 HD domain-containing protein [Bacilli bacterium]